MKKEIIVKEITITALEKYLNTFLKVHEFEEVMYNGAQITTSVPITRVVTAVSITLEVIHKAIALKAQAIIVHHGLLRKNDAHPLVGHLFEYVQLLIKHDIALLCYHLPLDAHNEIGNNWAVAKELSLSDCRSFLEYGGKHIGVIGIADRRFDALVAQTTEIYQKTPIGVVKCHDHIKTVAIVSGGADRYIKDAAQAGADCFITGRVDEPVWDDAHEYNVSFLAFGHYATEVIGPKLLAQKIQQELSIDASFVRTDNPF